MWRLWRPDKFNALPNDERNSYIAKNLGNLDPELMQAFLEMPEYSNLPCDLDQIRNRALRARHGEALDQLEQLDEAISVADRAVRMAREEIAQDSGVDLAKFDAAAKPNEKPAGPWLKKYQENGAEVVRVLRWSADPNTGGTMSIPTEEELQTGQFYKDIHEYREAHGLGDAG